MKCSHIQNRLADLPNLREVPDNLREHLKRCSACQTKWRQLLTLEKWIPKLPVPVANPNAKAAFVDAFLNPDCPRPASPSKKSAAVDSKQASWMRHWPIGSVAVALFIGLIAIYNLGPGTPELPASPSDPFLNQLVAHHVALSKADSADKRIQELNKLAMALETQMHQLALIDQSGKLKDLARMYGEVIQKGLVTQVQEIEGDAKKKAIADMLTQLDQTIHKANRVNATPMNSGSFKDLIKASEDGKKILSDLLTGRVS